MHICIVSKLQFIDGDEEYLKSTVDKVLSNGVSHHVKDIYERVLYENPSFLNRLGVQHAFALYSIIEYLFREDYNMSRPYIANPDVEINTASTLIDDLIYSNNEIMLSEIRKIAYANYYQIGNILEFVNEYNDTHLLVDRNRIRQITDLGIDKSVATSIEDLIFSEVTHTIPIRNLKSIYKLQPLSVPWNEWLVYSIIYKWGERLEVGTSHPFLQQATPVIARKGELQLEGLEGLVAPEDSPMQLDDLSNIDDLIADYIETWR